MKSTCPFRLGLLALTLLVLSVSSAKADTIFDQTNTSLPTGEVLFQNVAVFSPIGQSFAPSLTSLNFVNLLTESGTGTSAPFTLEVEIRSGSISGAILGTSQLTTVIPPPFAFVVTPFTFSTPVTLLPGNPYVMQVLAISGEGLVGSANTNNYPRGTQILSGIAQPNNDLWFQEGVTTPEPSTTLLITVGLIGLAARRLGNFRGNLFQQNRWK